MKIQFRDFTLDTDQFELRDSAGPLAVEPKVLDLLLLLASNPERVLTKDEIIEQIWDGRIVSEATISSCVKAARRAVGDDGRTQGVIKTIHGRGFRFVADLAAPPPSEQATPEPCAERAVFVQPSILVLPPRISGIPNAGWLQSVDSKLIRGLARVPFLTVISRRVAAGLSGASFDELRQKVGRGYVLDLELSEHSGLIVGQLELIETSRGSTIWTQQVSVPAVDDAEQQFVGAALVRLEPVLGKSILDLLRADPTATGAKPLMIKAMNTMSLQGWHGASFSQAEKLLRQAVEIEPDFAHANATLALILALGQKVGFAPPSAALISEAIVLADTALAQDDTNSVILGLAGCALADAGQVDRAIPILNRALEDDPQNAQALAALGSAFLHQKQLDQAAQALEKSVSISPMDKRLVIWRSVLAIVYMQQGKLDKALDQARHAVAADDRTYFSRLVLTGVQLSIGDQAAAHMALAECLRLKPNLEEAEVSSIVGRKLGPQIMALAAASR